jgi:flavin reductase (DIM6/NTAB) family NADH-FMN oxidoreductase RutF
VSAGTALPDAAIRNRFRLAMRNVASSVFVVATRGPDGNEGMTATSVCSLSLDPASVLVCVNRANTFMKVLEDAGRFTLNVLSREDEAVARAFGTPVRRERRFIVGDWYDLDGLPALKSSLSTIVCDVAGRMDFGSHRVFVGQVRETANHAVGEELLYCQGAFRTLQKDTRQLACQDIEQQGAW